MIYLDYYLNILSNTTSIPGVYILLYLNYYLGLLFLVLIKPALFHMVLLFCCLLKIYTNILLKTMMLFCYFRFCNTSHIGCNSLPLFLHIYIVIQMMCSLLLLNQSYNTWDFGCMLMFRFFSIIFPHKKHLLQ